MKDKSLQTKANVFYILTFIGFIEFISETVLKEFFSNIPNDCGIICFLISFFQNYLGKVGLTIIISLIFYIKGLFLLFLLGSIYFWRELKKQNDR